MKNPNLLALFCLAFLLNTPCQAQVNILNSLQACYPLDCHTNSVISNMASTGSALNGTLMGNVTCTTGHTGLANTALKFGGTPADIVLLPASPLIKPTTSLTMVGWFKPASNNVQDIIFTRNSCASSNFNMNNFIFNNGQFWIAKRPGMPGSCGGGAILMTPGNSYSINTWYHVVAYIDDSNMELTINNIAAASMTHNVIFDYTPGKEVVLGGTNEFLSNSYSGSMDNLRFYDRKLTAAEISFLYNSDPLCTQAGAAPVASFTVNKLVCAGSTFSLNNQSSGNPTFYSWQMPGGNPSTSSLPAPVVSYAAPGIYTITLTATNSNGQSAPVSKTLEVSACTNLNESTEMPAWTVFPNPASHQLQVVGAANVNLSLKDLSGRTINGVISEGTAGSYTVDLNSVASGIYLLQMGDISKNNRPVKITVIK